MPDFSLRKIWWFSAVNLYTCVGWKMKCKVKLPRNETRVEITKHYFLSNSVYEYQQLFLKKFKLLYFFQCLWHQVTFISLFTPQFTVLIIIFLYWTQLWTHETNYMLWVIVSIIHRVLYMLHTNYFINFCIKTLQEHVETWKEKILTSVLTWQHQNAIQNVQH